MSRTKGRSILLIEDNEDVLSLMIKLLATLGVDTTAAVDGGSALRAVKAHRPDLIITDLQLPDMDGLAAIRAIKQSDPKLASIPVVVLTGHPNPNNIREAVELGVVDFLVKPAFLSGTGLDRIRKALESAPPQPAPKPAGKLPK